MNDTIYILIQGSVKFKTCRLRGCLDTWLKNFKYYLISSDGSHGPEVNHIVATALDDWHSCPPKLFRGLEEVVNNSMGCKWIFICDDDTFVNYFNLISFCNQLDIAKRKLYGRDMTGSCPFGHRQLKFLSGGGGTLIPMHTAKDIVHEIREKGWMEWLCHPSVYPQNHTAHKEYPIHTQADNKLGWVAEAMGLEMVSFPHLFHAEPNRPQPSILKSITYHRRTSYDSHLALQKILDEGPASSI